MRPSQPVKVLKLDGLKLWALRTDAPATPETIGLTQARLLKICANLPRIGPACGLDHGEGGYEACRGALSDLPRPEELHETNFPGGWHAVGVHTGGYEALCVTLGEMLEQWLPHSGFKRREGPVVYRYITDPRETAEADIRTEICVPVQPDPIE